MHDRRALKQLLTTYRKKGINPQTGRRPTQKELAAEVRIHETDLSHFLNGTGTARLDRDDFKVIAATLVRWGGIRTRSEVNSLLSQADCSVMADDEWQNHPFVGLDLDAGDSADLLVPPVQPKRLSSGLLLRPPVPELATDAGESARPLILPTEPSRLASGLLRRPPLPVTTETHPRLTEPSVLLAANSFWLREGEMVVPWNLRHWCWLVACFLFQPAILRQYSKKVSGEPALRLRQAAVWAESSLLWLPFAATATYPLLRSDFLARQRQLGGFRQVMADNWGWLPGLLLFCWAAGALIEPGSLEMHQQSNAVKSQWSSRGLPVISPATGGWVIINVTGWLSLGVLGWLISDLLPGWWLGLLVGLPASVGMGLVLQEWAIHSFGGGLAFSLVGGLTLGLAGGFAALLVGNLATAPSGCIPGFVGGSLAVVVGNILACRYDRHH